MKVEDRQAEPVNLSAPTRAARGRNHRLKRVALIVETAIAPRRRMLAGVARYMHEHDPWAIYLKPNGEGFMTGDEIVLADYADTLQRLADAGGDDFYSGEIARIAAADFAVHDALVSPEDLRDYAVIDQAIIRGDYRGYEITSPAPPGSGSQELVRLGAVREAGLRVSLVPYGGLVRKLE